MEMSVNWGGFRLIYIKEDYYYQTNKKNNLSWMCLNCNVQWREGRREEERGEIYKFIKKREFHDLYRSAWLISVLCLQQIIMRYCGITLHYLGIKYFQLLRREDWGTIRTRRTRRTWRPLGLGELGELGDHYD